VNDRIFAGNTNLTQNYSISFWAYINSDIFTYPIGFGVNSVSSFGYGIGYSSSNPSCSLPINRYFAFDAFTSCSNLAYSQNPISQLSWKNIILTKNNNTVQVHVNGVLEFSTTSLSLQGIIALYFGVRSDLFYYFNGKLDDIGLWNRTLTQQEISNLYTNSSPPSITTSASPSLINCGETATLTASSTSTVQPCIKAELPATLQNGLVGYWPFCGNANDASGNNNNGTVNGATLTTDRFGNASSAYSFDGVNDWINLPSGTSTSLNVIGNYTLSLWMKTNQTTYGSQVTFADNLLSTGGFLFNHRTPNNPNNLSFCTGSVWNSTNCNLNNDSWIHFIIVANGNTLNIYRNGVLCFTNNSNVACTSWNGARMFGVASQGNVGFYAGKLDDIAIYNRALTASEIQQLYNLGNVTYSWSTGATTPSITVTPAQTSTYTCTATNSSGSTASSVTVTVADTLTWTGAVDTDWHKPCNWSPQFVPKCCNNVSVPITTNQPIVSGVAAAEDLTIYTTNGAQVTVNNGANLQIAACPTAITTATCPSLAVITTTAVSSINQTTAVSGGTISYQGASAITARGICWGTSPNPTIANSLTSNGTGIGTFTSNLTGLVAGTTYYVRAYATNGSGTSYGNQVSFVAVNPQPGYPANSVFCASGPTLVIDVVNPITGKTWMDRNLGATQAATSSTDAAAYGDLYQWGRRSDGHQCRTSGTIATLSTSYLPSHSSFIKAPNMPFDWLNPQNNLIWQGSSGINNPCPSGYRLPTNAEIHNERASWNPINSVGAFNSNVKFPMGGFRGYVDGIIGQVGQYASYWTSSVTGSESNYLEFTSAYASFNYTARRANGMSVRCIKF
jgi:uncharacterized protein (TIGR02145 family)